MSTVTGRRLNYFYKVIKSKVLRTREELEANTNAGYLADALLIKEINNSLDTKTLLWTNPNPASNFAAQTINIDLSKYDYVVIETFRPSGKDYYCNDIIKVGYKKTIIAGWTLANGYGLQGRMFTVEKSSVIIGSGYASGTSGNSVNDAVCIPINIYGVK